MYYYIRGQIASIGKDFVVVDNNGIGYQLYTPHVKDYSIGEIVTMPTYYFHKEDGVFLFGFTSPEERATFLKMIAVKGIGPKTANNVLSGCPLDEFIKAINGGDVNFLKKLPGVGVKMAQQLVVELGGSFKMMETNLNPTNQKALKEAKEVLLSLGYKASIIDSALATLKDENYDAKEFVKKALQNFDMHKEIA